MAAGIPIAAMHKGIMLTLEAFREHLSRASGREVLARRIGETPFWGLAIEQYPKPGIVSGFTYGLSVSPHPATPAGVRRELAIEMLMKGDHLDWPLAIAYLASLFHAEKEFKPNSLLSWDDTITEGSGLDAFYLADPARVHYAVPMVPGIAFVQAIPIFREEILSLAMNPREIEIMMHISKIDLRDPMRANAWLEQDGERLEFPYVWEEVESFMKRAEGGQVEGGQS